MSIAASAFQRQGIQPSSANTSTPQSKPTIRTAHPAHRGVSSPAQRGAPPRDFVKTRDYGVAPAQPRSAVSEDPVFNTRAAATILGVSYERLKKWRQRHQGPDYIQYAKGGSVRYALSALMKFRTAHTVRIGGRQ